MVYLPSPQSIPWFLYHTAGCADEQELLHSNRMTRQQRRLLFWISTFIFFIGVTPLLLYSFGYRFSFEKFTLLRAGGISIRPVPVTGAQIFIDGKLMHETSFLSRRLFLQGLTPRPYHIQVYKEGFYPWEKVLRVYPERVTEVHAFLAEEIISPPTTLLEGTYKSFSFFDNNEAYIQLADNKNKKIYYSIGNAELVQEIPGGQQLILPVLPNDLSTKLSARGAKGSSYDPQGERILWWKGNQVWIMWLASDAALPLYTEEREALVYTADTQIRDAQFYPRQEAVFITSGDSIVIAELDGRSKRNEYNFYAGTEPQLLISPQNDVFFILDKGILMTRPIL
ncbi:MAG: hypothetical protein UX74_C0003G0041 [Parcubacteria group bacterium GW2011_GWA2_47_10b]|nr:MAG: hypothetical protein UX74_C0003G0041 [Parcubacteria group bacterium GW2011_GWA2_47_10b]KKU85135.1 MAG: hypothetical protein UY14_C0032G0005 [Parcubacteria group bacterium GW2011_GWA1_47_9]